MYRSAGACAARCRRLHKKHVKCPPLGQASRMVRAVAVDNARIFCARLAPEHHRTPHGITNQRRSHPVAH
jgi:hypothetical protein